MNLKSTCAKLKCLRFRSLNLIFGIWPQTDIHTHASRNAVTLVWGSLRLAPIIATPTSGPDQVETGLLAHVNIDDARWQLCCAVPK